jgi:hypothetical protein
MSQLIKRDSWWGERLHRWSWLYRTVPADKRSSAVRVIASAATIAAVSLCVPSRDAIAMDRGR